MSKFGTVDSPIFNMSQDRLFMESQVKGMAEFIENCETPISISIQGAWGSGKTSFVNMVMDQIKQDYGDGAEKDLAFISFNTWQFVQFNLSDQLCASMITAITKELAKGIKNDPSAKERVERIFNGVEALKATGKLAAIMVNGAVKKNTDIDVLATLEKSGLTDTDKVLKKSEKTVTAFDAIDSLKKDLQKTIEARLGIDGENEKKYSKEELERKRVIVFVDDLDRLSPDKAIDVLETLKMFFESKHCVFLLAIDQEIIINGVSIKFKNSITEEKGRDFFEKLIQVVYTLPDMMSNTDQYVAHLLMDCGENIAYAYDFAELIHATGKENPRAIKRLINSFTMVKTMWSQVHKGEEDHQVFIDMFALLCLQSECLEFYETMASFFSGECNYVNCLKWLNLIHQYSYEIFRKETSTVKISDYRLKRWNLLKDNEPNRQKFGLILKVLDMVTACDHYSTSRGNAVFTDDLIKLRDVLKWTNLISNFTDTHSNLAAVASIEINNKQKSLKSGTIDEAYQSSFERMLTDLLTGYQRIRMFGEEDAWYPEGRITINDDFKKLTQKQRLEHIISYFGTILTTDQRRKADNWKELHILNESVWLNGFEEETDLEDKNHLKIRTLQIFAEFFDVSLVWYSDFVGGHVLVTQKQNHVPSYHLWGEIPFICVAGHYYRLKEETVAEAYYSTISHAIKESGYFRAKEILESHPRLFRFVDEMEESDMAFSVPACSRYSDESELAEDEVESDEISMFDGFVKNKDAFADDLESVDPRELADDTNHDSVGEGGFEGGSGDWCLASIASDGLEMINYAIYAGMDFDENDEEQRMEASEDKSQYGRQLMARAYEFLKALDIEFTWYGDVYLSRSVLQFSHADYYSRHLGDKYLKKLYKEYPQLFFNF